MNKIDQKTTIAVVVAIALMVLIVGGQGLISNMFSNSNSNSNNQVANVEQAQVQVQSQDIKVGEGDIAIAGKTVTVNYTGMFSDGKKFDSSLDPGRTPFTFKLGTGMVIKGWDIGVEGMRVGGKRILVIPPELGYGSQAYGPIPANSTLIFEVELLDVK